MKAESPPVAERGQKRPARSTNHESKRHKITIIDCCSSDPTINFDSNIDSTPTNVSPHENDQATDLMVETSNDKKNKKKPSQSRTKEDTVIDMIWICTECREAECAIDPESPLLVCEGSCMRPFHYPCAGLHTLPDENEKWICSDCDQKRHMCCVCQQYGDDNADVYKCEKKECGLFFHEACLSMYEHVQVEILGRNGTISPSEAFENSDEINSNVQDSEMAVKEGPGIKFTCPAHFCWTCCGGVPPRSGDDQNIKICNDNRSNSKKINSNKKGKGKKKNNALSSAFQEKKETLMRCLDCPNAYHISCLPPHCQFHELAMLCHEHSQTSKLPYLDISASLQKDVEQKADALVKKLVKGKETAELRMKKIKTLDDVDNPFLPGMKGDATTLYERRMIKLLSENEDKLRGFGNGTLAWGAFCLPVGIQQEVHSKPPVYTHVHSNQYDPKNRPKRHPPTGEFCSCIPKDDPSAPICDDHCINRIMGVECIARTETKSGQKNPYANCNHTDDCGNRQLGRRQFARCKPKREKGKGWGLVSIDGVKKGQLVQEYAGEIIDEKTKRERLDAWGVEHPNDPNFYIMSLENGWYIDARVKGNLSRFINHSCGPNCHLVPLNVNGHFRVAIIAIKNINPGEFLCYDYHFDTMDKDKFVCRCGAANCRGTMKGGANHIDNDDEKKQKYQEIWNAAKLQFDKDIKYLEDLEKDQIVRLNQVGATLPGESGERAMFVASGPDIGNRSKITQSKVCLWRNIVKGADFESRYARSISSSSSNSRSSSWKDNHCSKVNVLAQLMKE